MALKLKNASSDWPDCLGCLLYTSHKGRGLEWLAHHLCCTLANVIAIGDSENDLTMLQMAGLGVAMANSEPCIREAADVITGSNTENGVAQAIYRHILGDER